MLQKKSAAVICEAVTDAPPRFPARATRTPPRMHHAARSVHAARARKVSAEGLERADNAAHARPPAERGFCLGVSCPTRFCAFMLICLIMVPLAIFGIAALFAAPLYAVECEESKGTGTELCNFYQWFLYISSNLVGLGNPLNSGLSTPAPLSLLLLLLLPPLPLTRHALTSIRAGDYTPASGHVFAELFDLLIAAWSMAFAGLVYGLVGAQTQHCASDIQSFTCSPPDRRVGVRRIPDRGDGSGMRWRH